MMNSTISGANFKKMLMKASHTKGYLPHQVKQHLQKTKLSTGTHASTVLHNDNAKVHKRDAIKIIKALKDERLIHGVVGSPTRFVDDAIHHQKVVEKQIEEQRKADRAKDLAKEHEAEVAKEKKPTTPAKPMQTHVAAATPIQHKPIPPMPSGQFHRPVAPSHSVTPTRPTIQPGGPIAAPKAAEEAIDLAID